MLSLTCATRPLLAALALASRTIDAQSPLPTLAYGHLQIDADGAPWLTSTDLEQTLIQRLTECNSIDTEGDAVLVPITRLLAALRTLDILDTVTLDWHDAHVHVRAGKTRLRFPVLDAHDFPTLPTHTPEGGCTVNPALLLAAIASTAYAISQDSTRDALRGLLWQAEGATLTLAATDGHRLVETACPLATPTEAPWSGVTSRGFLALLSALLSTVSKATVSLHSIGDRLALWTPIVRSVAQCLQGRFADYRGVIPARRPCVHVPRETFLAALRTCQAVGTREQGVWLRQEEGTLLVCTEGETGSVALPVEVTPLAGADLPLCVFKAGYLLELATHAPWETLALSMSEPLRPLRVDKTASLGESCAVVMPLNPATVPRPTALTAEAVGV
jgi:DNA polymerase-3 subunit beta